MAYQDLPNRQLKVGVADRNDIKIKDAEWQNIQPFGSQNIFVQLVFKLSESRQYFRPSGTEDVVWVYAEDDTQENADQLTYKIDLLIEL